MRRLWTALVLLTLFLSACSTTTADPTTTTTGTADSVAPTTTTAATTTTATTATTTTTSTTTAPAVAGEPATAAEAAARFDLAGDDLVAVARAWYELYWYFDHNPIGSAAEMVDELYTTTYGYRDDVLADFAELVDNDWRYVDPSPRVLAVKVLSFDGDNASVWVATERGVDSDGLQVIADAEGNQVKTYPGWDLIVQEMTLIRSDRENRWLVEDTPRYDSSLARQDLAGLGFDWMAEDL